MSFPHTRDLLYYFLYLAESHWLRPLTDYLFHPIIMTNIKLNIQGSYTGIWILMNTCPFDGIITHINLLLIPNEFSHIVSHTWLRQYSNLFCPGTTLIWNVTVNILFTNNVFYYRITWDIETVGIFYNTLFTIFIPFITYMNLFNIIVFIDVICDRFLMHLSEIYAHCMSKKI